MSPTPDDKEIKQWKKEQREYEHDDKKENTKKKKELKGTMRKNKGNFKRP